MMTDGQNTQKWLEEHQQVTLIAATAATMDADGGMTDRTSKLAPESFPRCRVNYLHTSVLSNQGYN
jgi:hypothetical protein